MRTYMGLMSLILLAGALWLFARRLITFSTGVSTDGRVVAHEKHTDDGSDFYLPVVVFTDREGREHRFTSMAGWSQTRLAVGDRVTVRYRPESPQTVFIVSFLHMWAAPLAMFVLGAGALLGFLRS